MAEPVSWTFLTNHAQVLICLAEDPEIRLRDIGDLVGITERAAHRIVGDLIAAGYVKDEIYRIELKLYIEWDDWNDYLGRAEFETTARRLLNDGSGVWDRWQIRRIAYADPCESEARR